MPHREGVYSGVRQYVKPYPLDKKKGPLRPLFEVNGWELGLAVDASASASLERASDFAVDLGIGSLNRDGLVVHGGFSFSQRSLGAIVRATLSEELVNLGQIGVNRSLEAVDCSRHLYVLLDELVQDIG